jgi:hypothetical protein
MSAAFTPPPHPYPKATRPYAVYEAAVDGLKKFHGTSASDIDRETGVLDGGGATGARYRGGVGVKRGVWWGECARGCAGPGRCHLARFPPVSFRM